MQTSGKKKKSKNYAPLMMSFRSDTPSIKGDATTMHQRLVSEQTVPPEPFVACAYRLSTVRKPLIDNENKLGDYHTKPPWQRMGVATIENRFSSLQEGKSVSRTANWNRALFLSAGRSGFRGRSTQRRMAIGNYNVLLVETQRPLVSRSEVRVLIRIRHVRIQ